MELDLFEARPQRWRWHLHGRYLVRERDGWPPEQARTRRVVYRFDGVCTAASEEEAREIFTQEHGAPNGRDYQWLSLSRGGEIKPKRR